MRGSESTFPAALRSGVEKNLVRVSRVAATQFRLDAPPFVSHDQFSAFVPGTSKTQPLSQLAQVFTVYIQSPTLAYVRPFAKSRPYITTSELAEYQTARTSHVSLMADPRLLGWEIKQSNIVVSRSGRVGEAYWVDKKLDGALVGDSFRVVPNNPADGPLIYAVLASSLARNFLSGSAYGSVVDHASLEQLRSFRIPQFTRIARSKITESITKAFVAREQAYELLDTAQQSVLQTCGLPKLNADEGPLSAADVTKVMVRSTELTQATPGGCEFRLEAHFYNPIARAAVATIRKCQSKKRTVSELAHDVIMGGRFKRNYVEADFGTPFLSGKNIGQIRPTDLKYLSNTQTEGLDDLLLKKGWTLVSCSGTIGRICFVWQNFEDYAASQHILRVIPNEAEVDPGYMYAFLSSPYGYEQIVRFRHGSVIDEITDHQLKKVIVPLADPKNQQDIGDKVRLAYEKRAEALRLEDEAQRILRTEIEGPAGKET